MKKKKDKKHNHKDSHKELPVVADPQPNLTIDQILNMNKASTTHVSRVEVPLPPEFPPAPIVGEFLAKSEEEYKEYMKRKFLREQWDNAVILFRMKQKNNDKEGMKQVLERISLQLKDLPVDEADSRRSTASETSAINAGEIQHNLDTTEADLDKLFKELKEENNRSENIDNPSNESPPPAGTVVLPPPTTHQYVAPPLPNRSSTTGKEPDSNTHNDSSKEESGEDDESSWKYKWYRSTLYNTFFSRSRRRIIFVPIQVLLLIMIIISTAVSNIAAGILCGLVGGLFTAGLAGWIVWSFRNHSKGMPWVIGFLVAEAIAELFSIIGGFARNGNFIFYLGIPGIVIVIAATIVAYIGIIKDALEENSRKSEMV